MGHKCFYLDTIWLPMLQSMGNVLYFRVVLHLLHLRTFKMGQKPKIKNQKCKINSRSFTYDGLTFSTSSFVLEVVKDEC